MYSQYGPLLEVNISKGNVIILDSQLLKGESFFI